MRAFLKNYRQSPRKVRLVADLIRKKNVKEALVILDFLAKRAGFPIKKLLMGAIANAKQKGISEKDLFIDKLEVNKGIVMKRMMPRAMGKGSRINKRTSHVLLVLGEQAVKSEKLKVVSKPRRKVGIPTKKASGKLK